MLSEHVFACRPGGTSVDIAHPLTAPQPLTAATSASSVPPGSGGAHHLMMDVVLDDEGDGEAAVSQTNLVVKPL